MWAGPRYFFLPFVALSWTLVSLLRQSRVQFVTVVSCILVCVSLLNLGTMFSRSPTTREARLSWKYELERCAESMLATVQVPVYFDGSLIFWHLELAPAQCRQWVN
jgi:hypothetical protein